VTNQWQYDPRQQQRPATPPQWQQQPPPQPYGYAQPYPPQHQQPPAPPRHDKQRSTVTVQTGSNAFHWTMTVLTCGMWLLVWPLFRRKVRVTTKYR
jgi:hypothetical protein